MITRLRVIRFNEQSDNVANLHAAMRAVGVFVDAAEERERRAGDSTVQHVRDFQKQAGITPEEGYLVDAQTAAAMSSLFEQRGLRLADAPRTYSVRGTVTNPGGTRVRGVTIVVFDQDLRLRSEIGRTRTDARGEYLIWYDASAFARAEKGDADLVVEARSTDKDRLLHTTEVVFNAPHHATIDVRLPAVNVDSEYERILRDVIPLLDGQGVTVETLDESEDHRDVTFLANETGLPSANLAHFAIAFRLQQSTGIDAAFWYGALRMGGIVAVLTPGQGLSPLARRAEDALERARYTPAERMSDAIRRAVQQRILPAAIEEALPQWLERFENLQKSEPAKGRRKRRAPKSGDAKTRAFHEARIEGKSREDVLERLRSNKEFTERDVLRAEAMLSMYELALDDDDLVSHLQKTGVEKIDQVHALAAKRADAWEKIVADSGAEPPDFIAGEDDDEKRRNYAALLEKRFRSAFPTAAFTGRLTDAIANDEKPPLANAARVAEFLRGNPQFDLASTSVEGYLAEHRVPGSAEERTALIIDLKAAQRIFKVAPTYEATKTLLADGVHSAQKIYRMGKRKFVDKYSESEGFNESTAADTYHRAANTYALTLTILGELRATLNGNDVAVLTTAEDAVNEFPNLAHLFGKADICECEECRSIFSPAAYFADVMQFLSDRDAINPPVPAPVPSSKSVLFSRRPDLGYVELSCENSHTPLPYVDLVCEILEDRVALPEIFTLPAPLQAQLVEGLVSADVRNAFPAAHPLSATARVSARDSLDSWVVRDKNATYRIASDLKVTLLRQTRGTAEELAANPEYVNDAAYATLRTALRPLALPFDLPVEELRAYLEQAGVSRARLMEVFHGNAAPNNATPLDIAAEAAGIARNEHPFILAPDANQFEYWGGANNAAAVTAMSRVDTFLNRTGLEYADLLRLLSIPYVNPGGAIVIHHTDESCDTSSKRLQVLDRDALDRIHRFLRLWRKLGWKMWEVGLVIGQLGGDIDNGFALALSPFLELKAKFPALSVEQLAAFFADINTKEKFTKAFERPEPSLYEKLFLNKRLMNPIEGAFTVASVTAAAPTPMGPHVAMVAAATRTSLSDLEILRNLKRPNGMPYLADAGLRLSSLSFIYRHAVLARELRIKIAEWEKLLSLAGVDPFVSTTSALDFVKLVERVKSSGFTTDALRYILASDPAAKAADPLRNILTLLTTLRTTLQAIAAANDPALLPATADDLTSAITAHLQTLGWPEAMALSVIDLFNGRLQSSAVAAGMPALFEFPQAITDQMPVGYDEAGGTISFTGFMTDAQRATLLGDPALPAAVTGNASYQAAIEQLHAAPRLLVKFYRPRFTVALPQLPAGVQFATQLSKPIAAKIAYEPERRELSFFGIMTATERDALNALSVNGDYTNAIASLFNQPRVGVFPADRLWLAPGDVVRPLADNLTANLTTAATRLANHVIRTSSKDAVVQQFATALRVSEAIAETLVTSFSLFGHPILEDFTDSAFVTSVSAITNAPPYEEEVRAAYWLHRVALVIRTLRITFADLDWIVRRHAAAGITNFGGLPLDAAAAPAALAPLLDLAEVMRLHHDFSDGQVSLLAMLERLIADAAYTRPLFAADAELLMRWPRADVETLTNSLDLAYPAAYRTMPGWRRLQEAFDILLRLNAAASAVLPLAGPAPGPAESAAVKALLRGRVDEERWLEISKSIQDRIRERKRDSLVAYLLTQPMPAGAPTNKWENANDLFAYFLIDVEMSACQPTSRIVQASAAAQFFVQRAFMGLEPDVVVNTGVEPEWEQWAWMKYYRVWEANRRVFAYPENYALPELRRDRSEIFKKLEDELLQNEINRDNVETAFLHYLDRLDEVSHLEVAGTWYEDAKHILHVFARTAGAEPRIYYQRQFDGRRWSAWVKVDCDIQSDYVVPLVNDNRLYLVWPEFREEPQPPGSMTTPAENTTVTLDEPNKVMNVYIAITQFRSGKWTPKKVSQDRGASQQYTGSNFDRTRYALMPLDLTDAGFGAFVLLFFDTQSGAQSLFDLTGCRGYPELIDTNAFINPWWMTFERDGSSLHSMKNVEQSVGNALIPTGHNMVGPDPILGLTPEFFRITYSNTVSALDRLIMFLWILQSLGAFRFSRDRQYVIVPTGSFREWFYADKQHTFFVRPTMVMNNGRVLFYKDILKDIEEYADLVSDEGWFDFLLNVWAVLFGGYGRYYFRYQYLFNTFYHPLVCRFTEELNDRGVPGLMDRKTQFADKGLDFDLHYDPQPVVMNVPPEYAYPAEKVDFTPAGAYSIYNWELFFHAPLMIAMRLSKNQRFEDAMRWFHFIFDPTGGHAQHPITGAAVPGPQKYWITKPFFERQAPEWEQRIETLMHLLANDPANPTAPGVLDELERQVADWRRQPFDPHLIAQFRIVAYQKLTVMKYVENLIAWGDQRFRMETLESVNEATQLYMLAAEILGQRPRRVPPAAKPVSLTYNELEPDLDDFSNAIVGFENLIPPMPPSGSGPAPAPALPNLLYFCIPQNDQLLDLWTTVEDRLYKIRHCQDIEGGARNLALFAPRIDPLALVKAAAAGIDIGSALSDLNAPLPYYRFTLMVQKANEFVNDVKGLGASLLAALEKKDAEAMAVLRQSQELAVLEAVRNIKQQQIDDAALTIDGLQKNKELVILRRNFYASREFMNAGEIAATTLSAVSLGLHVAGTIADILSGAMFLIPDFKVGASGFGGSPHFAVEPPTGQKIGQSVGRGANGLYNVAAILDKSAAIATTVASYERRKDDWKLQADLAGKELEQIDKQIAGAAIKKQIAEKDLQNHDLQIANAKAMAAFMHDKYTAEELYQWMIGQISQTYFQSYQLAYDMAKRAERCLRYELGLADSSFVRFGHWDSLRSGLNAGERLQLDLRRLESAYLDQNRRELEVTKHVSLAMIDPRALLTLKDTGQCFVHLPEELFDLDYPGHYFRRIKSVSLSMPCIAGPHTTVSCTLRLLTNSVRTSASSQPQYERNNVDGIPGDDDRFRESHVRVRSIATSSAQNDSGLFELNFRDERYLPFEGAGVISRWSIELTQDRDLRQFAFDTISDVILHIRYTAREDGSLRTPAGDHLKQVIVGAAESGMRLRRLFDLKHEFPTEWYALFHPAGGGDKKLRLSIRKSHFPFFAQGRDIDVQSVSLHVGSNTAAALVAQILPIVPIDPIAPDPGILLEVDTVPPDPRALHHGGRSNLASPLDENIPWEIQIRKQPGAFNGITEADLREAYMVVEYTV